MSCSRPTIATCTRNDFLLFRRGTEEVAWHSCRLDQCVSVYSSYEQASFALRVYCADFL